MGWRSPFPVAAWHRRDLGKGSNGLTIPLFFKRVLLGAGGAGGDVPVQINLNLSFAFCRSENGGKTR